MEDADRMTDGSDPGETSSAWDSPYDKLAQFSWLLVVLGVMALIGLLSLDLRRPVNPRGVGHVNR